MKSTKKSVIGTSFHGSEITTTVEKLKQILGEPSYCPNDGADKVNFEWNMETEQGNVFTVYDYKEYRVIEENENICWHIGGKNKAVTEIALMEIQLLIKQSITPQDSKVFICPTVAQVSGIISSYGDENPKIIAGHVVRFIRHLNA